jgi:hypothetical protein
MKVVIYSCITGGYDDAVTALFASYAEAASTSDVRCVLFTDEVAARASPRRVASEGTLEWELRPLLWQHPLCQTRTARWHKVNSHLLHFDADRTIWIDGTQKILNSKLLALQLELPIATFKHPVRTCAYQELQVCCDLKKDNELLMRQQLAAYRDGGYPPFHGLVETACIVRKTCDDVARFNQAWWHEIERFSYRDQLSFNYTMWRTGMTYDTIPGHRQSSEFFEFVPHRSA